MTLGEKIRLHRTMKGLTQKQLGEMTGIHEVSIRKYEADRMIPKKEQLEKLSECLGVSYNEFVDLHISTDSDILPLLFAIDEVFEMQISSENNETFYIEFKEPLVNHFLREWQSLKELNKLGEVSKEDYDVWKSMRSSRTKVIK